MGVQITTAKTVTGKKIFYFIQSVDAQLGSDALLPAYRTDGSTTLGGEYIDEQTQQGRLIEKASDEHTVSLTQYFAPADPSYKIIEEASVSGKSVKVWEVIADDSVAEDGGDADTSLYPAKFGYGKVGEFERTSDVTDIAQISYDLNIVGALQDGMFPLTNEELALLNQAYAYQNPGETTGDYDAISTADTP